MTGYRIKVNSIRDMKGFVEAVQDLEGSCEVVSGRYRVNAKSLMAILAIPKTAGMVLELELGQEVEELPDKLLKFLWEKEPCEQG